MMHTSKFQQSGSAKILSGSVSHVASRQEPQRGTAASEVSVQDRHQGEKNSSSVARESPFKSSATRPAQRKPRSSQEALRQQLFADWAVEPLTPIDQKIFCRSWRIPFVFRDSFASPVGVSMWDLFYEQHAVMDGEQPGEGLIGHGFFNIVHLHLPWMEHNKEEYFLYCDTNKDDKYTVPDPDPQVVQQASLNCIGKRIADWFRTYMRAESKNRRAKDPCWKGIYFSEIHLASLYTNDKDGWDWHAEIYVARWQPSEEPEA